MKKGDDGKSCLALHCGAGFLCGKVDIGDKAVSRYQESMLRLLPWLFHAKVHPASNLDMKLNDCHKLMDCFIACNTRKSGEGVWFGKITWHP